MTRDLSHQKKRKQTTLLVLVKFIGTLVNVICMVSLVTS